MQIASISSPPPVRPLTFAKGYAEDRYYRRYLERQLNKPSPPGLRGFLRRLSLKMAYLGTIFSTPLSWSERFRRNVLKDTRIPYWV